MFKEGLYMLGKKPRVMIILFMRMKLWLEVEVNQECGTDEFLLGRKECAQGLLNEMKKWEELLNV